MASIRAKTNFDAEASAKELKIAMKGLGTDEKAIISILVAHDNEQRREIANIYKQAFGKDLIQDLKDELSGNFEDAVLALMTEPRKYDAHQLRKAVKGVGTDETALIEILCSRKNDEIKQIRELYKAEFKCDLEKDIIDDTSGHFRRLLVSQLNAGRAEGHDVDKELARKEAEQVFVAGEGQWGTDESSIQQVLATRNYFQLKETFAEYERLTGHSIADAIKKETSGSLQEGFLAIIQYTDDPCMFFAKQLYQSMKGLGTDDTTLIRGIVSRSEVDLEDIKECFFEHYGKALYTWVDEDCSGDYKRLLLSILSRRQ